MTGATRATLLGSPDRYLNFAFGNIPTKVISSDEAEAGQRLSNRLWQTSWVHYNALGR